MRRETTSSCSLAAPSPLGARFWRRAAGAVLALAALPCNGLEIGQITVYSRQGEPLDAVVRVDLDPGEQLQSNCLSAGTQSDFPHSDHILLVDGVRMRLQPDRKTIRITTVAPVQRPEVSIAVRARCRQGPVTVRAFNLRVLPPEVRPVVDTGAAPAPGASPAGTSITVKPGDSIYGLARTIFPNNEQAVRDLSLAIVMTNPELFPDGRPRPLAIGETLIIPDLRTVRRIVAQPHTRRPEPLRDEASTAIGTRPVAPPISKPRPRTDGKLQLKLARSLDLSRIRTADAGTRSAIAAGSTEPAAALSSRLYRIAEAQALIDARLAHLETVANDLQKRASTPPPRQTPHAAKPATAPEPPTTTVAPQPTATAPRTATQSTLWRWTGAAAGLVALAFAGFFAGRHWRRRRVLARRQTRIEEMLEQARTEATPLLGVETARSPTAAPTGLGAGMSGTQFGSDDTGRVHRSRAQRRGAEPSLRAGSKDTVPVEPSRVSDYTDSGEIPTRLRREMSDSIDGTRSMFTDIDRFIALGRIQNAINLLEFQIERQPDDRPSWIKLMAVYRHNGMDDDFDRTYANFRERFGDS